MKYIAGHCTLDDFGRLLDTAHALADVDRSIVLRAKVQGGGTMIDRYWQPAFSFAAGCSMLEAAVTESGLAGWATEVRTPGEAEVATEFGADTVWIGARNAYNYQLLEATAHACREHGTRLIIKRGLTMTHEDMANLGEVITQRYGMEPEWCERGISHSARTDRERWVYDFASHADGVCAWGDPSHGSCAWHRVRGYAVSAARMGATGLMLEVYADPKATTTDKMYAIGMQDFRALYSEVAGLE